MKETLDVALLLDGRQDIEQLLAFTQTSDVASAFQALSEGIFANRLWFELHEAKLVAAIQPEPLLAVFGSFSPRDRARLNDLSAQLDEVIAKHRYIDYPDAELAAERLARKLVAHFGREALARYRFTAIPRGGWIILGMLSYLLDLRPDQVIPSVHAESTDNATLIIVDDCALTGARFKEFLGKVDAQHVVFCPLFAVPDLCDAIEHAEPRVKACINAEDLHDVAPERFGPDYSYWCARRRDLMGKHGYEWVGIAEYIAFAWCEPQTKYWNTDTERFDPGWNVLPPKLSLKRRIVAANLANEHEGSDRQDRLICPPQATGPLRVADRVLWTEVGTSIAVARMPQNILQTTPCFRLEGTAADMWRCVLECGTLQDAEKALLKRFNIDSGTLRHDLTALVKELQKQKILMQS